MVDQQDTVLVMVDNQEVGHQMRRGRAGRVPAEDVGGAVQPCERVAAMLVLDRVRWHHVGDKSADFLMQRNALTSR